MNMRNVLLLGLLAAPLALQAAPQTFDFKDPKGVNNVVFNLDAPLEAITGSASGVSGKVVFDPQNPAATKGTIVIDASSLHVGNPTMKDHLHSDKWMDTKKFPAITFELKKLENVKTQDNNTTANALGTFTLKGVSKEISVPVRLTYLKDKLAARQGTKGDLLVVRAKFDINRSDFNINARQNEDKVSDAINLTLSVAGASPAPK